MTHLDTHTAIIGASGSGKTVTAKGDVEHLLDEKRHLAVIDPLGVWWGLRSAADGEGKGFDIPIFGGDHGDVQILPEHGEAIGTYIAGGMSAIVDLSGMEQREGRIFMLAFIKALRRKPKANFHLIVDEADEFAPQTAPDEVGFQLTEQMVWIAKRGRTAGFVLTAITQRPADISKAVLSQMQTVIAHQLVAPQDQKALDAYLQANGEPATRKTVMASLAGLERGERWFYSPRAKVLERDVSPMPRTFDSSRTPEPGEAPIEPKLLAAVDMGAIRAALAPKADQVEAGVGQVSRPLSEDERAELLSLRDQVAALTDRLNSWQERAAKLDRRIADAQVILSGRSFHKATLAQVALDEPALPNIDGASVRKDGEVMPAATSTSEAARGARSAVGRGAGPKSEREPSSTGGGSPIPASQQRVIDAIAWWHAHGFTYIERNRASVIAGLSPKASTFGVYISKLASAGLVDTSVPGKVALTLEGFKLAPRIDAQDSGQVVANARSMLSAAAASVFDKIVAHHPQWISRGTLADECGLSRTASTLGVYISKASALGFVETRPGEVRAADWLFPGEAP